MQTKTLIRAAHRLHRWLGAGLGALTLIWFASGAVMTFARYPEYTDAERLERAPELTPLPEQGSARELAAWLRDADSAQGARARLAMLEGRATWTFTDQRGVRRAVRADTASGSPQLGAAQAQAEAESKFGLHARSVTALLDADQWTVGRVPAEYYPLYQIAFDDPAHTEVYVSSRSAEIVQASTRRERILCWLGAIPHWLYPAILRRERAVWRYTVLALSGLGLALTISGLVAGVHVSWRTRARGVARYGSRAVYLRWHQRLGLAFGLFASTWLFSGALSLSPFQWSGPDLSRRELERWHGHARSSARDVLRLPAALAQCRRSFAVQELELFTFAGRTMAACVSRSQSLLVELSDPDLSPTPLASRDALTTLSARLADLGAVTLRWQREPDDYHYPTHADPDLALPYLRVTIADDAATAYYLDPARLHLLDVTTRRKRLERWLYRGLHCWDFPALYRQPWLWHCIVLAAMAVGLALASLGLALPVLRLVRRRRQLGRDPRPNSGP